jgi:hypothetical protein
MTGAAYGGCTRVRDFAPTPLPTMGGPLMFLLEAIVALSILVVVLSVGLLLLKLVFAVALVPIKLALVLAKGLLVLIFVLPLLLVVGAVFAAVLPLGILLLALPALALGSLVFAIAGC